MVNKTLTEIYNEKISPRDSDIPQKWKESFAKFMMGQTCQWDPNTGECTYYWHDFSIWYNKNKIEIERDSKIDQINR